MSTDDPTTGYLSSDYLTPPVDRSTVDLVDTKPARDLMAVSDAELDAKIAAGTQDEVQYLFDQFVDRQRRVRDNFNRGAS